MAPEPQWTWKVTYETATVRSGRATEKEAAERAAWAEHDRLVARGLNPDALAYFVCPPAHEEPDDKNRAALARKLADVVLQRAGARNIASSTAEVIWFLEDLSDGDWFQIWKLARASRAPSEETKRAVRELLLENLPVNERLRLIGPCGSFTVDELVIYSAEDRAHLRKRALDRALATHESARSEP